MRSSIIKAVVLSIVFAFAFLACGADDAVGDSSAAAVELGERYNDPMWGLSVRPPALARRMRKSPGHREWQYLNPDTGSVLWSFRVRRIFMKNEKMKLKTYAEKLASQLEQQNDYEITSKKLAPVAGKAAIDFRGKIVATRPLYNRQVWILAEQSRFLVVSITGPIKMQQRLDDILQASMDTLKITDPGKAIKARKEQLNSGQDLLASLKEKHLAEAIITEPQWFTVEYKGKTVGFMRVTESAAVVKQADGYEVKMLTFLDMPDDKQRLLHRRMFTTADRSVEWWRTFLETGSGPGKTRSVEEGYKKQDVVVCTYNRGGDSDTQKNEIPVGIYLPQAMGWLLGRLVNLEEPARYSFAVYNSQRNDFDFRTFALREPRTFEISGRRIKGYYATDRASDSAGEVNLWLDSKGVLKRMETPQGLKMTSASRARVLSTYSKARKVLAETGRK